MKVVGYARVSTEKQAEFGLSLGDQKARLQKYADLYDHEVVGMYEDVGSASTLHRAGLDDARMQLVSGRAEGVLVASLDRLTRSLADLQTLLEAHFHEGGEHLMSLREYVDTSSPTGRLVLNLLTAVSEFEVATIGERTSAALQAKKERGEFTGGRVPFGYRLSENGVDLEPHPEERATIKAAMRHRLAGISLREVGRRLASDSATSRKGTVFGAKQVSRLLETGSSLLDKGEL
jgi:site-specific DNA recombinase